jgi:hypothetical protein
MRPSRNEPSRPPLPRHFVAAGAWMLTAPLLMVSIGGPRLAHAAPPGVTYELGAIPDTEDAAALRAAIERAIASANEALASRGVETDELQVTLRIEPAKAGFRATLEGSASAGGRKDVEIACIPCSESELVESIRGRYESLASDLADPATTDTPPTTPERAEPTSSATDDATSANDEASGTSAKTRDDRSPRRLGPAGVAGSVALGVGVTAVGVGIGLAVKPDEIADPTPGVAPELRSTHTPGYALLGIGGAAVVTGIALVVVDRVRANRSGTKPDASPQAANDPRRRIQAAPWANPLGGGVVLSGRF